MGVQTPKLFSYRTKVKLEWQQVLYLVNEIAKQTESLPAVIDIDANNVAYNFMNKATTPVGGILHLAESISKCDTKCEVCMIVDGDTRYDTKRASTSRRNDISVKKIKAQELQSKLCIAIQSGEGNTVIKKMSKELEPLQTSLSKVIDTTFSTDLEEAIGIHNHSEAKGSITFRKTESQADPLISKRSSDII